jgi:D-amino-acid dehydrogenase
MVERARELGLSTDFLTYDQLQAMEPDTKIIGKGAVYFKCDGHLYPDKLMRGLMEKLKSKGVKLLAHEEFVDVEKENGKITKVITKNGTHETDHVVLAAGSWSRQVAAQMNISIPMVAGRGYSITLENSPFKLNHPAILLERRVAITPMDGNKIRFGGTMEVTAIGAPPRMNRVKGILDAVKTYIPSFDVPFPKPENVWYGYRPCSADGLPHIGRSSKWKNVVVATGHSMLGLSLGAGTGKLVSEIMNEETLSMNIDAFAVERFS